MKQVTKGGEFEPGVQELATDEIEAVVGGTIAPVYPPSTPAPPVPTYPTGPVGGGGGGAF